MTPHLVPFLNAIRRNADAHLRTVEEARRVSDHWAKMRSIALWAKWYFAARDLARRSGRRGQ